MASTVPFRVDVFVVHGKGMVDMSVNQNRTKWAEHAGLWQQVDGLYNQGVFVNDRGMQYVRLNHNHVLCRCSAVGNVISVMNMLSALGYQVTVTATDSAAFPTALTAIIHVSRDFQMRVMQSGCGPHAQDTIPGSNGWPSATWPRGAQRQESTVSRLIMEYESNQDRGRRASGLFDRISVMIGIHTDLRGVSQQQGVPLMNRRRLDGFITESGRGMFIAAATGDEIVHRPRPPPLCDAEPLMVAPKQPSVLEGANALRGFGYTVRIAGIVANESRPSAATATILVPRWQLLEHLYDDMPTINSWS
jgi:hypothetical protein